MEIEDISVAGHSTTVSGEGPEALHTSDFQDGNARDVSSSLKGPPAVGMCNLRWISLIVLLTLCTSQLQLQDR